MFNDWLRNNYCASLLVSLLLHDKGNALVRCQGERMWLFPVELFFTFNFFQYNNLTLFTKLFFLTLILGNMNVHYTVHILFLSCHHRQSCTNVFLFLTNSVVEIKSTASVFRI